MGRKEVVATRGLLFEGAEVVSLVRLVYGLSKKLLAPLELPFVESVSLF